MSIPLRLDDVRRAWEAHDPLFPDLVERLAAQVDDGAQPPPREGAPTFDRFLAEIRGDAFRRKPPAEQAHYRVEQVRALEAPDAEVPLPDRLRLHEVLDALWRDDGPFARACLLAIIDRVRLTYGPWRALKRIFKEAEAKGDLEVFGALAARFDAALAGGDHDLGPATLRYLCRRAWRSLRRTAVTLPAAYADAAAEVLARYPEATNWSGTWVANQVFYHETHAYNRTRFTLPSRPPSPLKERAFAELWRRSPRPLFALLERARSDRVREFAASALKADFRASLREVEPAWLARLVDVRNRSVDEFVVWILNNVPRFEQAAFRTLGLHDVALRLFDSPAAEARVYAAEYARTHARDLPVDELVRLADNSHHAVRGLAGDLLLARDPRREVGLDAWGRLLESNYGNGLAAAALRKHFGARELTPEWFQARLLSSSYSAFNFAREHLLRVHPRESLGPGFFAGLIETLDERDGMGPRLAASYAMEELARFDLNALDPEFLKRLLIRPATSFDAAGWIDEGRLKARTLPVDFYKVLAFHPTWEADPWLAALGRDHEWARSLAFDEALADRVLGWLGDVRRFSPSELGFDWLMRLVDRAEPRYHNFAVETMIKGFVPADFAPEADGAAPAPAADAAEVDLAGASFLFTGKMATMPRAEAESRVRQAGGSVASGVNAKLHYLVIGDEGSPFYGHGKKGSKQLKAEELNAAGANITIVSETAFLKRLAGEAPAASADRTLAGCERLWSMATAAGPADAPRGQFAIKYLRRHHPDIALAETDRPVDPGAEVPAEFLTFDRVKPLFSESRRPLRELALELARWEFARWAPPVEDLVALAEVSYPDVRQFVAQALLADDAPEHRRYRLDASTLTPDAVYRFCESADEPTRALGMQLIARSPRLRVPDQLFRLTESPDPRVRAFVIRTLWSLYRDRGITGGWTPYVPPQPTVGASARKAAAAEAGSRGPGPPARPERWPADPPSLWQLLRRVLFEVPPARGEAKKDEDPGALGRIKPLPARRAKLALVEVLRDLALEDAAFARGVLPLLDEFLDSRGASERAACLVAVTRIRHAHPELRRAAGEVAS